MLILGGPIHGKEKFQTNAEQKEEKKKKKENIEQLKIINQKLKSGKTRTGKPQTKAQRMALERRRAKLKGTYEKPKTAQELAKRNIKKYGGTASAAAANKESMRKKKTQKKGFWARTFDNV